MTEGPGRLPGPFFLFLEVLPEPGRRSPIQSARPESFGTNVGPETSPRRSEVSRGFARMALLLEQDAPPAVPLASGRSPSLRQNKLAPPPGVVEELERLRRGASSAVGSGSGGGAWCQRRMMRWK